MRLVHLSDADSPGFVEICPTIQNARHLRPDCRGFHVVHAHFWRFVLLRRRRHSWAAAQTGCRRRAAKTCYSTVHYRHPQVRSECKQVFTMGCNGEGMVKAVVNRKYPRIPGFHQFR